MLRSLIKPQQVVSAKPQPPYPPILLKQTIRPFSPALRHLRYRKQPDCIVAIAVVDPKDISDSEGVVRFLDYPDLISGAKKTTAEAHY